MASWDGHDSVWFLCGDSFLMKTTISATAGMWTEQGSFYDPFECGKPQVRCWVLHGATAGMAIVSQYNESAHETSIDHLIAVGSQGQQLWDMPMTWPRGSRVNSLARVIEEQGRGKAYVGVEDWSRLNGTYGRIDLATGQWDWRVPQASVFCSGCMPWVRPADRMVLFSEHHFQGKPPYNRACLHAFDKDTGRALGDWEVALPNGAQQDHDVEGAGGTAMFISSWNPDGYLGDPSFVTGTTIPLLR